MVALQYCNCRAAINIEVYAVSHCTNAKHRYFLLIQKIGDHACIIITATSICKDMYQNVSIINCCQNNYGHGSDFSVA